MGRVAGRMRTRVRVRSRALAKARAYAVLEPELGYPDINAAILMAQELVRLHTILERA